MRLLVALLALQFQFASAPYHFVFPRDHGAHVAYQSEWWYFTGHLQAGKRRFGYELTFFRYGLRPGEMRPRAGESRWRGSQIYPAHFAIADEASNTFVHYERFSREALGMGRAAASRLDVASGDWWLRGDEPIRMHAAAGGDVLDLRQRSEKPPAIHGSDGISRKGPCASCASHYYSLTRLSTRGTLAYRGVRYAVEGISWMDHEFGSSELGPDQVGWDWFSLQLDDGRELMLYRLRRKDGTLTPQSSGSAIDRRGRIHHLALRDFEVEAAGEWVSPHTRARYPSGWRVRVPSERIDVVVTPVVRDQELADPQLGIAYWEGDCGVSGSTRGVAYVELTGYAGKLGI